MWYYCIQRMEARLLRIEKQKMLGQEIDQQSWCSFGLFGEWIVNGPYPSCAERCPGEELGSFGRLRQLKYARLFSKKMRHFCSHLAKDSANKSNSRRFMLWICADLTGFVRGILQAARARMLTRCAHECSFLPWAGHVILSVVKSKIDGVSDENFTFIMARLFLKQYLRMPKNPKFEKAMRILKGCLKR